MKACNFVRWPGLNIAVIKWNFPESDKTQKGHMKQQQQNVRSTKKAEQDKDEKDADEDSPSLPKKGQDLYIKICDISETMYMDQMGCFPV